MCFMKVAQVQSLSLEYFSLHAPDTELTFNMSIIGYTLVFNLFV